MSALLDLRQTKPDWAKKWLVNDTKEYFHLAENAVTIHPHMQLTDEGKAEKERVLQRVATDPGKHLERGELESCHSGFWEADREHPFYAEYAKTAQGIHTIFNTFQNLLLCGKSDDPLKPFFTSSVVVWYGQSGEQNWVITSSGSLYRYKTEFTE